MADRRIPELLRDWLPALVGMALIYSLSSLSYLPGPADKVLDYPFKKLAHVLAYGTLALFYLRAVRCSRRPFAIAFLLAVLYAVSDEVHQSTVPRRGASLVDVAIDAFAAAAALWAARRILRGDYRRARVAVETVTGTVRG